MAADDQSPPGTAAAPAPRTVPVHRLGHGVVPAPEPERSATKMTAQHLARGGGGGGVQTGVGTAKSGCRGMRAPCPLNLLLGQLLCLSGSFTLRRLLSECPPLSRVSGYKMVSPAPAGGTHPHSS